MKDTTQMVLAVLFILSASIGGVLLASNQEARSYNKFCNTPVTTWDAVWLDLRIDECNNK